MSRPSSTAAWGGVLAGVVAAALGAAVLARAAGDVPSLEYAGSAWHLVAVLLLTASSLILADRDHLAPGLRAAHLACGLALPALLGWACGLPLHGQGALLDPQLADRSAWGLSGLAAGVTAALALAATWRPRLPSGLLGTVLVGLTLPLVLGRTPPDRGPEWGVSAGLLVLGLAAWARAWTERGEARERERTGPRRGALLVAAAGMLLSVGAGALLHERQRLRGADLVDRNARGLQHEAEACLSRALGRLTTFQALLRAHGEADLPAELETGLQLQSGYLALARIGREGTPLWAVPDLTTGGLEGAFPAPPWPAPWEGVRAVPAPGSGRALAWVVLCGPDGRLLAGLLDLELLLRDLVTEQRERGFGFSLWLDGQRLLSRRPQQDDEGDPLWRRTWTRQLGGGSWEVAVTPAPALRDELLTAFPDGVLGAGLLLACGFALLFRLERQERQAHRELEATSQQLREEVQERVRAEAALERSNRDLDEFAAVAAHDLRAPLRALRSLAGWIEEDLGGSARAETREHLQLLRSRVGRMEQLLDGLLQYARAGQPGATPGEVDVEALLEEVRDLLQPPPGFVVRADGPLPVLVTARVPLQQVLLNLVGNALKHHDLDRGQVVVSAQEAPGELLFRVRDDGPGIPPDQHGRAFQLFRTLRSRDRVEGSGMGLPLVRRLVGRQGGHVQLLSPLAHGRGLEVRFTWPRTPRRRESATDEARLAYATVSGRSGSLQGVPA